MNGEVGVRYAVAVAPSGSAAPRGDAAIRCAAEAGGGARSDADVRGGDPDGGPADARAEAELLGAVSGIVDGMRRVHADAVDGYRPEVEALIHSRSRDVDRIERTLDGLIAFCSNEAALALFKRLCRYYWDLDPEATSQQVLAFREWFDSEGA